jgi:hypothetical protein
MSEKCTRKNKLISTGNLMQMMKIKRKYTSIVGYCGITMPDQHCDFKFTQMYNSYQLVTNKTWPEALQVIQTTD